MSRKKWSKGREVDNTNRTTTNDWKRISKNKTGEEETRLARLDEMIGRRKLKWKKTDLNEFNEPSALSRSKVFGCEFVIFVQRRRGRNQKENVLCIGEASVVDAMCLHGCEGAKKRFEKTKKLTKNHRQQINRVIGKKSERKGRNEKVAVVCGKRSLSIDKKNG